MNEIDDLLEQQQILRRLTQAGADHDAVETLRSQCSLCDRLGGVAQIDQAARDVVAGLMQLLDLGVDVHLDQLRCQPRKCGEICKRRIQADSEHSGLHLASYWVMSGSTSFARF